MKLRQMALATCTSARDRRRGEHSAERGGNHVLDRLDLGARQSMRRRARTPECLESGYLSGHWYLPLLHVLNRGQVAERAVRATVIVVLPPRLESGPERRLDRQTGGR